MRVGTSDETETKEVRDTSDERSASPPLDFSAMHLAEVDRELARLRSRIADSEVALIEATDREAALRFELGELAKSAERHRSLLKLPEALSLVARVEGAEMSIGQCAAAIHDLDRRLCVEEGKVTAEVREIFQAEVTTRIKALEERFEAFKLRDDANRNMEVAVDNLRNGHEALSRQVRHLSEILDANYRAIVAKLRSLEESRRGYWDRIEAAAGRVRARFVRALYDAAEHLNHR